MIPEHVSLTEEEVKYIREKLGREPNFVEWGMFDVMWSEHISYKSSKPLIKLLPTESKYVIVGPGQDAGVIDIGDGYAIVLKIESHNHPSAIDPYNGAATGVGGIIRDILAMGGKPIALLDSLRFGPPSDPHCVWLLKNVVRGIADYGNCIGVPTVAGEVEFDESFRINCLVNVGCVGLARKDRIIPSKFIDVGDLIIVVGGSTGRDGIRGASFASKTLGPESESDRPAVQVGDPFTEKLLMDAVLEAIEAGYVKAAKDLGGGGLTCAISEMAADGDKGVEIEISKLHLREEGMTPYEIMLSESQERMLLLIDPRHLKDVEKIFKKYDLPYAVIGKVTDTKRVVVKFNGEIVVDLPAKLLAKAPVIRRRTKKPNYIDELRNIKKPDIPEDLSDTLLKLLSSPNIASKSWVYEQYDHEVGIRTVIKPGQGDAAVLRIPEINKAVAITIDGNSKHTYLDPYNGAAGSLAEACRNLVSVGAKPLAFVDEANFGNPEKPEVFWQFSRAFHGLSMMARSLGIPCVGGKVSFYNEDEATGTAVKPTMVIAAVGLIESYEWIRTMDLKQEGNLIAVVGITRNELGGSEYYYWIHKIIGGRPPTADPELEKSSMRVVLEGIRRGYIVSAHDVSHGGLAVSIAEMAIKGNKGVIIDLDKVPREKNLRIDEIMFSESYARYVIEIRRTTINEITRLARETGAFLGIIGEVTEDKSIRILHKDREIVIDLRDARDAFENGLRKYLGGV